VGWDSLADVSFTTAAIFPGQAILFSRMMDVFTLTGEAMKDRGNFFASMFIVLAAGCLVIYFVLGWSVNVIAQVCGPLHR
jgi:ATP-binding cassette subfamily B (MDR/TAP) protein 1